MFPVFTIRNKSGQFLGTYRAKTAKLAIQRFVDDQLVVASQFKRGNVVRADEVTATIETR